MIKYYLKPIKQYIDLAYFRTQWRIKNKHNFTNPFNVFPIDLVTVGNYTYGNLNVYSYRNQDEKLIIGNFCSIASDVIFVLSGEHTFSYFSTYPFEEKIYHEGISAKCKGPIIVEDDVWIGVRCTILSGVTVGQGSVIGANSIVTKDIPPYSIFVGNRVIGKRFSYDIIDKLLQIDFNSFSQDSFADYHAVFKEKLDSKNIDFVLKHLPLKAVQ